MHRNRLGCLSGTGIIAALIAILSIAGYGFADGGVMFSPGPLNAVSGTLRGGVVSHADIDGDCDACHVAPWESATMDDRCLVCHANVAADLGNLENIHGQLIAHDPTATCRECHPEHHGQTASLTVLDRWKFPHEVTGYSLSGHPLTAAKEPFQCGDCHGADITVFEPETCQSCHNQIDSAFMVDHAVTFGTSCLDCHDGLDRFGSDFDHNLFAFKLNGGHATVPCAECHFGAHTIPALQVTHPDCFSCHQPDDPHRGSLGTDCGSCHSVEGWKSVHFDHNLSTFKLTGAHVQAACATCHQNNLFKGTPQDCLSCHQKDEPHEGRFGSDCAECHSTTAWSPAKFDHNLSVFKLTGAHVQVACESCHINKVYRGTPQDCFSCHKAKDPHQGQFGKLCSQCHDTSNWQNIVFDHNSTSFPLRGSHSSIQCAACHMNGVLKGTPGNCFACHAIDDRHNGQFGRDCAACHDSSSWKNVSFNHNNTAFPLQGSHTNVQCTACHQNGVFNGTPKNCFACHANDDRHNGQFGADCAACHNVSSWKNVSFDHNNTAFPLQGSHGKVQCASCHVNGIYKGTPKNCYACHAKDDAHNGQFGTECGSCHKPTRWQDVTFNHNNSAFPLTGKHASVQCRACHTNGYQGTPKNCYACHAKDDRHNGQFGKNCGSCHSPNGWGNASFDHNNTAFPLVGKHRKLECQKCHRNGVYQGTPTRCVACHEDKHNGANGPNCGACHTPTDWGNVNGKQGLFNVLIRMDIQSARD